VRILATFVAASLLSAGAAGTSGAVASTSPASVSATEQFTGGGALSFTGGLRDAPQYTGHYTSSGQLGSGRIVLQFLLGAPSPIDFTRSDGLDLHGLTSEVPVPKCGFSPDIGTECLAANLTGGADVPTAKVFVVLLTVGFGYTFLMRGTLSLSGRHGYALVESSGAVHAFGGVERVGDAPSTRAAAVDIERSPSGGGYWVTNAAGQVYAFGDAPYLGGAAWDAFLSGQRVVAISATPTDKGYWLFTADGRALRFGDAQLFGDLHIRRLTSPIVASAATPTGRGYYMVGADGGVFTFGDARFRGSTGAMKLNQPVVGIAPTTDNKGYWLVAADGGVFSFNAPFRGSMGGTRLNQRIVTMVPYAGGYLMIGADGGVFNFSGSTFFGSLGGTPTSGTIVGATAIG
jgi:hypothetical protein